MPVVRVGELREPGGANRRHVRRGIGSEEQAGKPCGYSKVSSQQPCWRCAAAAGENIEGHRERQQQTRCSAGRAPPHGVIQETQQDNIGDAEPPPPFVSGPAQNEKRGLDREADEGHEANPCHPEALALQDVGEAIQPFVQKTAERPREMSAERPKRTEAPTNDGRRADHECENRQAAPHIGAR